MTRNAPRALCWQLWRRFRAQPTNTPALRRVANARKPSRLRRPTGSRRPVFMLFAQPGGKDVVYEALRSAFTGCTLMPHATL